MNTIDQGPKDGDFVAYIEELERRQLHANQTPAHAPTGADTAQRLPAAVSAENTTSIPSAATVAAIKTAPLGLAAIGLVLIVAGILLQGGVFLIAMGIFLLWQAARPIIRAARRVDAPNPSPAAQQVAALLAAHAERKRSQRK
ncbi:MAG TPA: hypothetical protein VLW55_17795 [Burkholderiaceae bacterium]|nr:hypothetical protein [Burkholderiaceae bacterium]